MSNAVEPILKRDIDIARLFNLSVSFLRKDRRGARIVPFVQIGTCVRYCPDRVREALLALEQGGQPRRQRRASSA